MFRSTVMPISKHKFMCLSCIVKTLMFAFNKLVGFTNTTGTGLIQQLSKEIKKLMFDIAEQNTELQNENECFKLFVSIS